MVIDATNKFAARTAKLMFTLTRQEMEERLDMFPPSYQALVVQHARRMAGK